MRVKPRRMAATAGELAPETGIDWVLGVIA